jgi:molecular chaperone HtpG
VAEDFSNRERLAPLLRFTSTHADGSDASVDLASYKARMQEGQEAIYYITAENHQAASHSPHLEVFRKQGIEVLLMSDRVDEWMMAYFHEFDGTPFKSVAKGDINLSSLKSGNKKDGEKDAAEAEADTGPTIEPALLEKVSELLGERVKEVRVSQRLTDSASCLVLGEQEMALHLQRLLEQAGQQVPDSRPVLELNAGHPLVKMLQSEQEGERFGDLALILYEQALLSEGGSLTDPAEFVRRINSLLLANK